MSDIAPDHLSAFASIEDFRALSEMTNPNVQPRWITGSHIVKYAFRDDNVADLRMEQALRREPRVRALYTKAMFSRALACSLVADAASESVVTVRTVGPFRVEIVEEDDLSFLIIQVPEEGKRASWLELRTDAGLGTRVRLVEPIGNVIQLPLDHRIPELKIVDELVRRPDCQFFIWP